MKYRDLSVPVSAFTGVFDVVATWRSTKWQRGRTPNVSRAARGLSAHQDRKLAHLRFGGRYPALPVSERHRMGVASALAVVEHLRHNIHHMYHEQKQ